MRIRTQFLVTMVLFGLVLALIAVSLVVTDRQVERLNRQEDIALQVERAASDLSYLSNDYLLYQESQQKSRWQARYAALSDQVARLDPPDADERAIVDNIKANQARLNAVFSDVVSTIESRPAKAPVDLAFVQVSWSRMQVQDQEMVFNASLLWGKLNDAEDQVRQTNMWLVLALVGVFGIYLVANYWAIYRRVLSALASLRAGTQVIGSGNLDYAIPVQRTDEIGELAGAFNQMTADLKQVTASRQELTQEIAERKRAEETVKSLAKFPEENPNPVMRLDSGGIILYANSASRPLLDHWGVAVGQVAPEFWRTLVGEAYASRTARILDVDVEQRVYWISAVPLPDAGYVNLYGRDVTVRKRAEERVQALNAELELQAEELQKANVQLEETLAEEQVAREQAEVGRNILESLMHYSPEVLILADGPGINIRMISQYAEELLGFPIGKMLGIPGPNHPFRRSLYYADGETPMPLEEMPLLRALCKGETILDFEFKFLRPDGERLTILSSAGPIRDHRGSITGSIAAWRDVSVRKRSEERIHELNSELERRAVELEIANRELESFSYSVSHDLRTPLSSIKGFTSLLLQDYGAELAPNALRYLQLIQNNSLAMTELIEGLLGFSRSIRMPVNRQTVDLDKLVGAVLDELASAREGRPVEIVRGDLGRCQADPVLIKQVWMNLLSNALKFTRLRNPARIEISAQPGNGECVFCVRDNGVGFDPEGATRLFGVFQRLHSEEDYEGTGVGLAIVERIVRRHGGRIWAEAEIDKGATFYFTLPA